MKFLDKIPDWIRWILFFPCALLVSFIVYPMVLYLNYVTAFFYTTLSVGGLLAIITKIGFIAIASVASGASFVWVGTKIAPNYKVIVSIVLVVIIALLVGIGIATKLILGDASNVPWTEVIVSSIGTLFGGIGVVISFHEEGINIPLF